jgi:hypothetical protein
VNTLGLKMNISASTNYKLFLLLIFGVSLYISLPIVGKPYFYLVSLLFLILGFKILSTKISIYELVMYVFVFVLVIFMTFKAAFSLTFSEHKYVLNPLILFATILIGKDLAAAQVGKSIKVLFIMSFFVMGYELYYRFNNPVVGGHSIDTELVDDLAFYAYKINSLMYENSNGVGMHLIFMSVILFTLFSGVRNVYREFLVRGKIGLKFFICSNILIFLLLLGSLSRAAILVYILLLFVFLFSKIKFYSKIILLYFLFTFLGFFIVFSPSYLEFLVLDESFMSKFDIFNNLFKYVEISSFFDLLVGNTLENPELIYGGFVGYVGHVHFFDFVFRLGLLLTFVYLFIFFLISFKLGSKSLFFLLAFFILGLINIRLFSHYLFFFMGLLYVIHVSALKCLETNSS